ASSNKDLKPSYESHNKDLKPSDESSNKDLKPSGESSNKDLKPSGESNNKDLKPSGDSSNRDLKPSSDSSNKDLASSDSLLQWRQGPLLGRGSYGSVHQGLTDCGRIIAVKRVFVDCAAELRRIRREVDILSCMSHPNIVQLFGTRESDGEFHIAMELVPGGSIRSLLDRFGALTERQCRGYLGQAVSGLAFLHQNGILHGDIKGHNIMVSDAGVVKLIDFGCSRRLHQHLGGGSGGGDQPPALAAAASLDAASLNGTPYWMAPELVLAFGGGAATAAARDGDGQQLKSDCWAIGCTLLEMATTLPPYSDMPPLAAVFAIGRGSPEPPALPQGFSEPAAEFYATCLRREPASRPTAQELLRHEFLLASP
uniref:Protein kinase domain-containing protein n=1 Tax=Macrostomum lignano TaxID=282301 RepID=A0A1I8HIP8_9PLAT